MYIPNFRSVSFFVYSGVGYNTQTDEYATEFRNIGYGLLASREFKSIM